MLSNLERYKEAVNDLVERGGALLNAIQYECLPEEFEKEFKKIAIKNPEKAFSEFKKNMPSFKDKYQEWYSEVQAVIKQLLPDRLEDFIKLYEKPKNRKEITYSNYVIEDYLKGLHITRGEYKEKVVGPDAAIPQFQQQLNILKATVRRFESSLFEIRQMVQADLFDSELEVARELLKNKFFRAAGAIAGVVLEKYLSQVCENHNVIIKKRDPSINDLNDLLKSNGVADISQWRFVQHLADLRNLCDHNKKREPKPEEVEDLINGVDKVSKTLF
jgi:hypothetical protein